MAANGGSAPRHTTGKNFGKLGTGLKRYDLDVVAVSLLPPNAAQSTSDMASILWLEQTTAGNFVRHVVETGSPDHSSCELVDWDSDGDLDLCVTHFRWSEERGSAISWFRNVTNNPPAN